MINPATRVGFLDQVRGAMAVYVALAHLFLYQVPGAQSGLARLPWVWAQEAVMIFFLVSGAAIRLSVQARGNRVDDGFLRRRFLRLFPILALGLVLGYAGAAAANGMWVDVQVRTLLGNLLFLQDFSPVKPGTWVDTYLGNATLWSLSYEWWFYVMFFVVWRYVHAEWRTHAVGGLSVVALAIGFYAPNALSYWAGYFILWWAGGSLVEPNRAERIKSLGWVIVATAVVIAGTILISRSATGEMRGGVYPLLMVRHFGFVALVFAVLVATERGWPRLQRAVRGFGRVAPYSYALYVLHYPIAVDAGWLRALGVDGWVWSVTLYALCAAVAVWLAERFYQPWAQRGLGRLIGSSR